MIPGFEAIVEERIRQAQKEGAFDDLPGAHKPLKFDDMNVPEPYRLAYKILKNSGFLPPEVELKKKIAGCQDLIGSLEPDSEERKHLHKKLNYLLTRLETARGSDPGRSVMSELYREQLIQKIK